jgi:sialate O-acetylesterase
MLMALKPRLYPNDPTVMKKILLFFALSLWLVPALQAELRLPGVIGDHMVLQQQQADPIWGWDSPGTQVTVSFAGKDYSTTADADGRWMVKLAPLPANSTPQTLTIVGSTKRVIQDVLVGEVWLCSGQSNMEFGLGNVTNGPGEIAAANFPGIRLLKVPKEWLAQPQADQSGNWKVCTPETVAQGGWNGFSAVGYFFGRELHRTLNVPVGLVDSTWGGTRIESWTAPEGFAAVPALSALSAAVQLGDPRSDEHKQRLGQFLGETETWLAAARAALSNSALVPVMPVFPSELLPPHDLQNSTALYNGMIYPLHPLGIRGAIWYQGEANVGEGMLYADKMKALVDGWRQVWNEGDFPFYFAQLAPYNYGGDAARLPELWEAQATAARDIPNAGMAVINDIGNLGNIHPKNKQEVGRRLALLALARTYGHGEIVDSGPTFHSLTTEGDTLRLQFDHADGGLVTRDGQPPTWFEIVDEDGDGFVKARARIDGATVVLSAPEVHHPVAMRFAWNQLAEPNLMNGHGLPAGAFRAGTVPKYDWLARHVPESKDYQLVYDLDLSHMGHDIHWDADNRAKITAPFDRIAYSLDLQEASGVYQSVYVSMDAFSDSLDKIGVPTVQSGAHFQQNVTHLNVFSNVKGIVTGTNLEGGNIEFWPNNYGPDNSANVPNASSATFDFGDQPTDPADGYGSMQVHNHDARQTIFAINHWSAGEGADLGMGNSSGANPDWTFAGNAGKYRFKHLRIFVHLKTDADAPK